MLEFKELENGFNLLFKNYLFLTHSQDNPCFKLGKGKASYKIHHGHFKIREKELIEIPLKNFNILSKVESKLIIEFISVKLKVN